MFSIKETSYGLKITLGDAIREEEMAHWGQYAAAAMRNQKRPFGLLLDLRTLKPLDDAAAEHLQHAEEQFLRAGLERAAVVLDSTLLKLQVARLGKNVGLSDLSRYVDASAPDWEERAQAWVVDGQDPEQ